MGNLTSSVTSSSGDIPRLVQALSRVTFREITTSLREIRLKYGAQHFLLTQNELEESLSSLPVLRSSWLFDRFGGVVVSVDEMFILAYLLSSPESVSIEARFDAILNLISYSFYLDAAGCSTSNKLDVHRDDLRYMLEAGAISLCKGGNLPFLISEESILSVVDDIFGLDFDKHYKNWAEIRTRMINQQDIIKFLQKFLSVPYIPDVSRSMRDLLEGWERKFINTVVRSEKAVYTGKDPSLTILEVIGVLKEELCVSGTRRVTLSEQDMQLLVKSLEIVVAHSRGSKVTRQMFKDFTRGIAAFLVVSRVCSSTRISASLFLTLKSLSIVDESSASSEPDPATNNGRNPDYWGDLTDKIRLQLSSCRAGERKQKAEHVSSISIGEWMIFVSQMFEKRDGIESSVFKAFKRIDKSDSGALPYSEIEELIRLLLEERGYNPLKFSSISRSVIDEHIKHVATWLISAADPEQIFGVCRWEKIRENVKGLERNLSSMKTYITRLQQHENISLLIRKPLS